MQLKNIYKLISYFNVNHLFYSSFNALKMTSTILPISNFLAFKAGKSMNSRNLSQGLWYKKQFCLVLAGSFRWWCRTNCILKAFSTLCYTIFVFKIYLRVILPAELAFTYQMYCRTRCGVLALLLIDHICTRNPS